MFCYAVNCVYSSFVIIPLGMRWLTSLLWPSEYHICCHTFPLALSAMRWSIVCDCGTSWSYLVTICRMEYSKSDSSYSNKEIAVFNIFIWGGISSDIRSEI